MMMLYGLVASIGLFMLELKSALAAGTTHTMTVSGMQREYQLVLPGNLANAEKPAGILVALHGAGGSGPSFCDYAFPTDTERAKMIVLCPSATAATASASKSGGGSSKSATGGKGLRLLKSAGSGEKEGSGGSGCWRAFLNKGVCNAGNCEGPEDVLFIDEMVRKVKSEHSTTSGKVVVLGFSNGGSMAFRLYCELPTTFDAFVMFGQSWYDPFAGYYDYSTQVFPEPTATVGCKANTRFRGQDGSPFSFSASVAKPIYHIIGTNDMYYGTSAIAGMEGKGKWEKFSRYMLGREGSPSTVTANFTMSTGSTSCYNFPDSPVLNIFCSVQGMQHVVTSPGRVIEAAVSRFSDLCERGSSSSSSSSSSSHLPLSQLAAPPNTLADPIVDSPSPTSCPANQSSTFPLALVVGAVAGAVVFCLICVRMQRLHVESSV